MNAHQPTEKPGLRRLFGVTTYFRRAVALVWETNRLLATALGGLSLVAGVLPVAIAYIGKLVVDGVIRVAGGGAGRTEVGELIAAELLAIVLLLAAYRGLAVCEALLRVQLGQRVTELVLDKSMALALADFEDAEVHDQLTRVREQAASRPLSLVRTAMSVAQDSITLVGYVALLVRFSPWLATLLLAAALPAIFAEIRFNADAFRLFRKNTQEARRQAYFETVLTRDDFAKDTRLLTLGNLFKREHRRIYEFRYGADRRLTVHRGIWGLALSTLGAIALAVSFAWVAWAAMDRTISVGEMTMLLVVLKQAQSGVAVLLVALGSMYEDNLYLSTLYELLARPDDEWSGNAVEGTKPGDGIRLVDLSFTYPGQQRRALSEISYHFRPGETIAIVGRNGAGKSTLVKLIVGLYRASSGAIEVDGLDIQEWDRRALWRRMGVLFQDYSKFQLTAGQNIGVGDVDNFDNVDHWKAAARRALIDTDISRLPRGYDTQLGNWFATGQDLSAGQWQRIAIARTLMRPQVELFIFDEPTARLDRRAEAAILSTLRNLPRSATTIVVSHRLRVAQSCDRILVLRGGELVEAGSHHELLSKSGEYAALFSDEHAQLNSSEHQDERVLRVPGPP